MKIIIEPQKLDGQIWAPVSQRILITIICASGMCNIPVSSSLNELCPEITDEIDNVNCVINDKSVSYGEYSITEETDINRITGLLVKLPTMTEPSVLHKGTSYKKSSEINTIISALSSFGIEIKNEPHDIYILPGQKYTIPDKIMYEYDWRLCGMWMCCKGVGQNVSVLGLNRGSVQRESEIELYISDIIASTESKPAEINITDIPHAIPLLCAISACYKSYVHIKEIDRMSIEDSTKLHLFIDKLKINAEYIEDSIKIQGSVIGNGIAFDGDFTFNANNDFDYISALIFVASMSRLPIIIENADILFKTYESFNHDYNLLGGKLRCVK